MNDLTYSANGLALTEKFEGCRLTAYQDQVGVWTIGYGHTGPEVVSGLSLTIEQAQVLLAKDIGQAAGCVNRSVTVPLTQAEFDALVDFVFNLGTRAFEESTLLKQLNSGNFIAAAAQFDRWDRAGGAIVAGLLRRRQAETGMFNSGATSQDAV